MLTNRALLLRALFLYPNPNIMNYDDLDNTEKGIYNETLELIRQKRQELNIEVHELNFMKCFRDEGKQAGKRVYCEIFGNLDGYNEFFNY